MDYYDYYPVTLEGEPWDYVSDGFPISSWDYCECVTDSRDRASWAIIAGVQDVQYDAEWPFSAHVIHRRSIHLLNPETYSLELIHQYDGELHTLVDAAPGLWPVDGEADMDFTAEDEYVLSKMTGIYINCSGYSGGGFAYFF